MRRLVPPKLRTRTAAVIASLFTALSVTGVAGLALASPASAATNPIITYSTPTASSPTGTAAEEDMTLQLNADGTCPASPASPVALWLNTTPGTFYAGVGGGTTRFTGCGQTIQLFEEAYTPGTYVEDPGWISPTGYASFGTFDLQATAPLAINLSGNLAIPVGGTTTVTATIPSNPDGSCYLGSTPYANVQIALDNLAGVRSDTTYSWTPYETVVRACDTPVSFQVSDNVAGNHTITATYTNFDAPVAHATLVVGTPPPADTTPPVLNLPSDKTMEATGPNGAVFNFTATANDDIDGAVPVTCDHNSGDTFALGVTKVTCTAADAAGNKAAGSFNVTVVDTTAPKLLLPADVTVTATGSSQAAVTYTAATATDIVDGNVAVTCDHPSGSNFSVGVTKVTCTATDAHNNMATGTFTVTVSYQWAGFFQPVDNTLVNVAKAGQSIPVKFSLGGNQGLKVLSGTPVVVLGNTTGDTTGTDAIETYTNSVPGLTYDAASGQYTYVWSTPKSMAGTTRTLVVTLGDGSVHKAAFSFTK